MAVHINLRQDGLEMATKQFWYYSTLNVCNVCGGEDFVERSYTKYDPIPATTYYHEECEGCGAEYYGTDDPSLDSVEKRNVESVLLGD